MSLRVLVVDDAVLFRRVLSDVLASLPGVEVVGNAANGRLALQKVRTLRPDLVTLDIEMPEMDGLAVLDELRRTGESVEVIVVSAGSRHGGELTLRALGKGAFDFITKPDTKSPEQSRESLTQELAPLVRAIANRLEIRAILRNDSPALRTQSPVPEPAPVKAAASISKLDSITERMQHVAGVAKPEMVLIGVSTGGPVALSKLLPAIPADIGVPILIVQHMPPVFTRALADDLNPKCAVRVCEAVHGESPQPNVAYIAPGGRQMRLGLGADGRPSIQITDDPPENNCKPAVDYLFRSVANTFPGRALAVILTGMGSDGTIGLRLLKRHGCFVIAQDEASCVIYGMPRAAVEAGVTDAVLPLNEIAERLAAVVKRGRG
jgi:two-component system chemotaxis response regulator CheB